MKKLPQSRALLLILLAGMLLTTFPAQATETEQRQGSSTVPTAEYAEASASRPTTTGGPDGFGYTFVDSLEPGGACSTTYVDISTTGTALALADEGTTTVTLPFSFTFYGAVSSDLRVGNNGGILFNSTAGAVSFINQALPANLPAPAMLPFWDDLDDETGSVYYEVRGTAPDREAVIAWVDRPHFNGVGAVTFEVILYEGTNEIDFVYQDVDFGDATFDNGASATVGIQGNNTTALQYSFNTPALSSGLAICFTAPPPSPRFDNSSLTLNPALVTPGATVTASLLISNTGDLDASTTTITLPLSPDITYLAASVSCSTGTCEYDATENAIEWTGSVAQDETVEIQFSFEVGVECSDNITLTANINDPASAAGLFSTSATLTVVEIIHNVWDFEADDGGFVGNNEWQWGEPTYANGPSAYSGTRVWGTDLAADADDTTPHTLTKVLTLPDAEDLALVWHDWYGVESSDDVRSIFINDILVLADAANNQREWTLHAVDVSAWAGETITVSFSLEVCCAGAGPDGWYIDDVAIVEECSAADSMIDPTSINVTLDASMQTTATLDVDISEAATDWEVLNATTDTSSLLYDTGPVVTQAGAGAGGADVSELQTAQGLDVFGYNTNLVADITVAEDFKITNPEGWYVDSFATLMYQTTAPTATSPITFVTYRLWDGPPFLASSNIITGDLSTNRLLSTEWSGIYRVLDTELDNTARALMTVEMSAGLTLQPGHYWLEWAAIGSPPFSGPWTPSITIPDETRTGNAIQNGVGGEGWSFVGETGVMEQQGLPLEVYGDNAACEALPDWVSVTPVSGSNEPGDSDDMQQLTLDFDSTGLEPGIYTANLCLRVGNEHITVPLTLTVTGETEIEYLVYLPFVRK